MGDGFQGNMSGGMQGPMSNGIPGNTNGSMPGRITNGMTGGMSPSQYCMLGQPGGMNGEIGMGNENSKPFDGFCSITENVNYFKYICTIQNFSLRLEKTGEKIISPNFAIGRKDRSEWCLHIYPNGNNEKSKEYVSVFLMLLRPGKVKAKTRFCILNDKVEEKRITCIGICDYSQYNGWGYPKFVKKDFLKNKSNGLLNNDKLTILCEAEIIDLKSGNHENTIAFNGFYKIEICANYFKYKCSIQNFSLRPEKTGETVTLPTCIIGSEDKLEWCLNIYPNGDFKDSKEYVSIFLVLLSPKETYAKFRFCILNDKEEEKNISFGDIDSYGNGGGWGESKFVKKDFLLDESNGLLTNDQLTILCEVKIIDPESGNYDSSEIIFPKTEKHDDPEIIDSKTKNRDNSETLINITIPQSKLSLDYGNLYDSPLFFDCVIKVEDTEIRVHKVVLAARSPVFYNIFNSKSDESQTNIIEIKDFNVEVVKEMLKYIYTDEVSDIQNMANQMFEIASKYELHRLKAISEQFMCNSLSIENVCEGFALSDQYPTERLKKCCQKLILENIEYLKETKEWEKFILVRPLLLQSLLVKSFKNSSKESNSEKKIKNN
uniref:Speckle-type POZ protein-like (inferred by orthology to a human protein) n=1 Tax=Strongyloides venezuelensis TaxID=75913 RepID=A0A0K0G3X7_STRVS